MCYVLREARAHVKADAGKALALTAKADQAITAVRRDASLWWLVHMRERSHALSARRI